MVEGGGGGVPILCPFIQVLNVARFGPSLDRRSQAKANKGGPGGGPTLGPMLKSLQRGPKGGGGSG